MKTLRPDVDLARFFNELTKARARLLILDYDGTLAPFREQRDQALPYPGVREALTQLQAGHGTRVVLVLESLVPLVGLDPAPEMWGSHGWERRSPEGRFTTVRPGERARAGLERARTLAGFAAAAQWEFKPARVALHWRGLPAPRADAIRGQAQGAWPALCGEYGLELHEFDGGLELRVPGVDKGTAVTALLAESGPGTVAAYLGDDRTDEDAFRALAGRGLAILVREELRPTAAAVWLRPPGELLDFFQRWIAACPPRPATEPRTSGS
jgi:trehalose-phosphatase